MPWVEKRKNGYRLVVDLGVDKFGKRIRKTQVVETNSKRAAEKELSRFVVQIEKELEKGDILLPRTISFSELSEKYKVMFVLTELEFKSQENYIFQLEKRILPHFKKWNDITKINSIDIVEFIHGLKRIKEPSKPAGSQTKIYVYRVLKSIFQKASEWYNLESNPMDNVKKPKEEKSHEIDVYTEKEAIEVFNCLQSASAQFRTLVSLAFTTGMRRAEMLGLEWKHIDLEKGLIAIRQSIPAFKDHVPVIKSPKTKGSIRTVSIPPSIVQELANYRKEWFKLRTKNIDIWKSENEFLFCNKHGMPYYPKTLTEQWRSFIQKNKSLRYIRFHDLRHTSVTILINRGIHAKIISERIGHSKIGTTMDVYGHVIRAADAGAAATFDDVFNNKVVQDETDIHDHPNTPEREPAY
ncbi:site-specific integrase [Paenibacillus sp. MDMC362]|uniref:tyrosine-type recombinase/integrase n=1 Tax=Paenibacillus sp. MDMC362 TaxID=2977365 RepID=UPI000DC46689|nr:site-specific integrase [Paenibacillus sp. MDMC362]RAR39636.1 site-specific integrase [Paenibacillus sp. MDMC362]